MNISFALLLACVALPAGAVTQRELPDLQTFIAHAGEIQAPAVSGAPAVPTGGFSADSSAAIWNDAFPVPEIRFLEAPAVLTRAEVARRFDELAFEADAAKLIGVWAHALSITGTEKPFDRGIVRRKGERRTSQTVWLAIRKEGGFAPALVVSPFSAENVDAHVHLDGKGHEFTAKMSAGALILEHDCKYRMKWECRLAGADELLCRGEEQRHSEFPGLPMSVSYHGFRKLP